MYNVSVADPQVQVKTNIIQAECSLRVGNKTENEI